jgi:glyoxylase-like metal-dependent hydrolase (beta-lactamase superfamily II)
VRTSYGFRCPFHYRTSTQSTPTPSGGDDDVTLVDPRWADERSEQLSLSSLRQLGYTPGDVLRILVTHAHWDHYSRAISWQRRYGAAVFLGRQEHHTIEAFEEVDGTSPSVHPTYGSKPATRLTAAAR